MGPYRGGSRNLVWVNKDYYKPPPRKTTNHDSNDVVVSTNSSSNQITRKNNNNKTYSVCSSSRFKNVLCKFWKVGKCKNGDQCSFLHSWFCCDFPGLSIVADLPGHNKGIKGIALAKGSDKLYSVSKDGCLRIWDCHTGQCLRESHIQAEPGCLISQDSWVFLGLRDAIKAFNVQNFKGEYHLNCPLGQVNTIAVAKDMLFAGTSSGTIAVWKAKAATDTTNTDTEFEYIKALQGHAGQVMCLTVRGDRLYSGSVDTTIKAWDLNTLECLMTLNQHANTVTSLLIWDQFLLSSSLDGTVKVWATVNDSKEMKVVYTRKEGQGSVHVLCGVNDAEAKPVLLSSYLDGTVGMYNLPSFEERGKMFSTHTISTLTVGPGGGLFTGDESGNLRVWNYLRENKVQDNNNTNRSLIRRDKAKV